MGGDSLGDIALTAHEEFSSPSAENPRHQFRQGMNRRGIKHEADVGIAPLQLIGTVLLGDHTSAHADDYLGIRFLQMLVLSDDGQGLFLRVLADRTGIHKNQLGLGGIVGDRISHQARKSCDPFAVRLVLLTAEGLHEAFGRRLTHAAVFFVDGGHLMCEAELLIYILRG